jgi:UDP-N-acetylglucosamine--N-acetylmuramyl-(pentapeptide) pyrophosphoryl-undecaprenol N-acetylglucosamine transferase
MVMGGSQGAKRLNELVAAGLPRFASAGVQVLHISGPSDYELVRPAYEAHPDAGVLKSFCSEMQFALAAADLAICRSGASTLTELAYYELPSVLIPYPFAAEDHQTTNAEIFSDPGAAELWTQGSLTEESFAEKILELIFDDERLAKMRAAAKALAIPDASERVCEVVAGSLK